MRDHSSEYSVQKMAKAFKVSRSGYYKFLAGAESLHKQNQSAFDAEVKSVFESSKERYGSVRIGEELVKRGYGRNRKRVAKSMRRQDLRSKVCRKFRVTTTDSEHDCPVAPNIVNREFSAESPNRVWVSDITYLPCRSGWLYLTVVIDLFSRLVVGWSLSTSLKAEGTIEALRRAIWQRRPAKGLIFHSDRGIQYCCEAFRSVLQSNHVIQSMSRKGNCWDNAVSESFFKSLKTELVYHIVLIDEHHARHVLFEYIELFYNRQRLHSSLGYVSPAEYETVKRQKCA
jgi:putative transposase